MIQLFKKQLQSFKMEVSSVKMEGYTYSFNYIAIGKRKKTKLALECLIEMKSETKINYARIIYSEDKHWYVGCGYEVFDVLDKKSTAFINNLELIKKDGHENHKACLMHRKYKLSFNRRIYQSGEFQGGVLCTHIQSMLSVLPRDILEEMELKINTLVEPNEYYEDIDIVDNTNYTYTEVKPKKQNDNELITTLNKYSFRGESIMILGHAGYGKTYSVKLFAEENKYIFCELQGHQQIETIDMFGYLMESPSKQKVWYDGPVSRAARLAASGDKVVLFIDEFVNIPMRETAGLKAALEPYKEHYYFQTNRMINYEEGIGESEIIKVPVANLQIVVASNIGNGYVVEELDKALIQRFLIVNHTVDLMHIISVLNKQCIAKGFDFEISDKLVAFYKDMKKHYDQGMLASYPSLRHLSRKLLGLIDTDNMLLDMALAQKFQWIEYDNDGNPDSIQVGIVEATIEKNFT